MKPKKINIANTLNNSTWMAISAELGFLGTWWTSTPSAWSFSLRLPGESSNLKKAEIFFNTPFKNNRLINKIKLDENHAHFLQCKPADCRHHYLRILASVNSWALKKLQESWIAFLRWNCTVLKIPKDCNRWESALLGESGCRRALCTLYSRQSTHSAKGKSGARC